MAWLNDCFAWGAKLKFSRASIQLLLILAISILFTIYKSIQLLRPIARRNEILSAARQYKIVSAARQNEIVTAARPIVLGSESNNSISESSQAAALSGIPALKKETLNNSGALVVLRKYNALYNSNGTMTVDPNDPSTVTTYWQAGAMLDWYMSRNDSYKCNNRVAKGNWHICDDQATKIEPPCLVYSFGIDNDFTFDDAMGEMGCEVHSFDPSMLSVKEHKRNENVTFHRTGIGAEDNDAFKAMRDVYVTQDQLWRVRTLKSIVKELGHENKVIDALKLDIECYEWNVTQNLLDTGMLQFVRQFLVEWHLMDHAPRYDEFVQAYKTLTVLRESGFKEFAAWNGYDKKVDKNNILIQSDMQYANAAYLKKKV